MRAVRCDACGKYAEAPGNPGFHTRGEDPLPLGWVRVMAAEAGATEVSNGNVVDAEVCDWRCATEIVRRAIPAQSSAPP